MAGRATAAGREARGEEARATAEPVATQLFRGLVGARGWVTWVTGDPEALETAGQVKAARAGPATEARGSAAATAPATAEGAARAGWAVPADRTRPCSAAPAWGAAWVAATAGPAPRHVRPRAPTDWRPAAALQTPSPRCPTCQFEAPAVAAEGGHKHSSSTSARHAARPLCITTYACRPATMH